MRTTLDLDADVLQAAKEMASVNGTTAGRVISDLVRKALAPAPPTTNVRNGVRSEYEPRGPRAAPMDADDRHRPQLCARCFAGVRLGATIHHNHNHTQFQ